MRRGVTVVAALLAVAALAGLASAYTYAELEYGTLIYATDARTLAMGGAGLASADGARGLALNPALVGKAQGIDVMFTASAVSAEEAREVPLYDSFEGVIAYNTYAMNMNLYDRYVGSVAWKPGGDYDWAPVVAVGYGPRIDLSYNYHVQYRNPDTQAQPADKILYDYWIENSGGVNAFSVAVSQEVMDAFFLGVGVDFLRGDSDARERWVYPAGAEDPDVDLRSSFDGLSGTQFTLGLLSEQMHRVDVAVVYRSSFTLAGDYSREDAEGGLTEGNFEYKYPDAIAVGLEYHPRNEMMTSVSFDMIYTRWSEFESDFASDLGFDDTIEYRAGVEHQFFDNTQARFGFVYQPSYFDEHTSRTAFCFGLGLDVLGARVDIGGQMGVREYGIEEGRLRETTSIGTVTLSHTF
jgi:hypothetical protein